MWISVHWTFLVTASKFLTLVFCLVILWMSPWFTFHLVCEFWKQSELKHKKKEWDQDSIIIELVSTNCMPWILGWWIIFYCLLLLFIPLKIEIYLDINLKTLLQKYLGSAIQIILDHSTISWARLFILSVHNIFLSVDPHPFLPSIEPIKSLNL